MLIPQWLNRAQDEFRSENSGGRNTGRWHRAALTAAPAVPGGAALGGLGSGIRGAGQLSLVGAAS